MLEFLHHWVWNDLWTPVWPNLAASAVTTIPLLLWHHVHTTRKLDRQHKAHLNQLDEIRKSPRVVHHHHGESQ